MNALILKYNKSSLRNCYLYLQWFGTCICINKPQSSGTNRLIPQRMFVERSAFIYQKNSS